MKSFLIKIVVMSFLTLFLFGCGVDEVKYEEGFPNGQSSSLEGFFKHYLMGYKDSFLMKQDDILLYSKGNVSSKDNEIEYYQHSVKQLEEMYEPLITDKNPSELWKEMKEKAGEGVLQQEVDDPYKEALPVVKVEKNDSITIQLEENEADTSLVNEIDEIDESDDIIPNLISLNEAGFVLHLENSSQKQDYYLFALTDLSEIDIYEESELDDIVEDGKLKRYYQLLDSIGESSIYAKLYNGSIVDKEKNTVYPLQQGDKRSENWNDVYLNGTKKEFSDGTQEIQTIEHYLEGNDDVKTEFDISFKEIAKELDMKTSGTDITKINYFDENWVVLRVHYKGAIVGSAGGTNVMIDLQEDHPTAYLVDLELK